MSLSMERVISANRSGVHTGQHYLGRLGIQKNVGGPAVEDHSPVLLESGVGLAVDRDSRRLQQPSASVIIGDGRVCQAPGEFRGIDPAKGHLRRFTTRVRREVQAEQA